DGTRRPRVELEELARVAGVAAELLVERLQGIARFDHQALGVRPVEDLRLRLEQDGVRQRLTHPPQLSVVVGKPGWRHREAHRGQRAVVAGHGQQDWGRLRHSNASKRKISSARAAPPTRAATTFAASPGSYTAFPPAGNNRRREPAGRAG